MCVCEREQRERAGEGPQQVEHRAEVEQRAAHEAPAVRNHLERVRARDTAECEGVCVSVSECVCVCV